MELNHNQKQQLLKRFPSFELSYEIISHKKVCSEPGICIAIPPGKKYYAWFTHHKTKNICYLLEINKEKKIGKISVANCNPRIRLRETILYGTILEVEPSQTSLPNTNSNSNANTNQFIVDDIYMYDGLLTRNLSFGEKFGFFHQLAKHNLFEVNTQLTFHLPLMWMASVKEETDYITPPKIEYSCHHVQYRELLKISPYLNFYPAKLLADRSKQPTLAISESNALADLKNMLQTMKSEYTHDYSKPQYRQKTIFRVSADIQFDIYHLHALNDLDSTNHLDKQYVYYGIACIPTYKSSVYMNGLFRKITENLNLDYIEESEDEEDFENVKEDKYVDLSKIVYMEFEFHPKFKKWVPLREVDSECVPVGISKLIIGAGQNRYPNYNKNRPHNQARHKPFMSR